jgi:cephalosporin hydroxylase
VKKISDEFHIHYEENRLWEHTHWLGVPIWKNPCDLLILQELIHKVRPEIIVETGTKFGGSALFFASIFELMGSNGKVITIDIDPRVSKEYYGVSSNIRNRIISHRANSLDEAVVSLIHEHTVGRKTMVVLDSWHSEEHVYAELEAYHSVVDVGSYLVVEDTHINNPIKWRHINRGPGAAVERFLIEHPNFEVDRDCEKLMWTFCPGGFIKRIG